MSDPQTHCLRMWLFVLMLLPLALPSCASLEKALGGKPEEDPQIVQMQRKLDRMNMLNLNTKQKVEEINGRILALQKTTDDLKANLEDLASRQISGNQPAPAGDAPPRDKRIDPLATEFNVKSAPVAVPGTAVKINRVSPKISPQRQYNKAFEAYGKRDYKKALAGFRFFLKSYPKHDLADNALYWTGEIYYDLEDYPSAISAFKTVVTSYPEASKAPDSLLKIAYCYTKLADLEKARDYFEQVIKKYPFSDTEAKAKAKLKELEDQ